MVSNSKNTFHNGIIFKSNFKLQLVLTSFCKFVGLLSAESQNS